MRLELTRSENYYYATLDTPDSHAVLVCYHYEQQGGDLVVLGIDNVLEDEVEKARLPASDLERVESFCRKRIISSAEAMIKKRKEEYGESIELINLL